MAEKINNRIFSAAYFNPSTKMGRVWVYNFDESVTIPILEEEISSEHYFNRKDSGAVSPWIINRLKELGKI